MDPANVPLPDTPKANETADSNAIKSPSATVSVLAASSAVPALEHHSSLLAPLYGLTNTAVNTVAPGSVRQGWHALFTAARERYITYPASYRYGCPALAFLIALAEYEQPGFFPRPEILSNAIVGLFCAMALVAGIITLQEYVETSKWPWQEEGWVWPWEAWLWGETVYDLGASMTTDVSGVTSPAGQAATGTPNYEPDLYWPATVIHHQTPPISIGNDNISMPSPAAFKQPIIIPPIPQLPPGMRTTYLPPPTPAQIHKSGLMGESPRPPTFKIFGGSGNAFYDRAQKLREVAEWSKPGPPLANLRTGLAQKLIEKKVVVGAGDGGNKVHEERRQRYPSLLFDVAEDGSENAVA
tara:strand:+ start:5641 stop:6705 length:1065 start_codon:yes stop_codon:yes gene_type:complete